MKIDDIIAAIEAFAPLQWQAEWDNSGLQAGRRNAEATGALLTLDATEASVAEAAARGINLIISHHPVIFGGLRSLTEASAAERIVAEAIRIGIAIYSSHTPLDVAPHGVSYTLALQIGLKPETLSVLSPTGRDSEGCETGFGCIGELPQPVSVETFLEHTARALGTRTLRHSPLSSPTRPVQRVAVCGGSGAEFMAEAARAGADAYLTGDLKYHAYQIPASLGTHMIAVDGGHYETEAGALDIFSALLSEKFPTFAVHRQSVASNPVNHYIPKENS